MKRLVHQCMNFTPFCKEVYNHVLIICSYFIVIWMFKTKARLFYRENECVDRVQQDACGFITI